MGEYTNIEIDVAGTVADDRRDDRRNIEWLNFSEDRRSRVRRGTDRMEATREEIERLCAPSRHGLHRPATREEILRIARRETRG